MILNGLDWMNYWNYGFNLVGGGAESWDAATAIAAASTYMLLAGLPSAYDNGPPGWWPINNEIEGSITGINTLVNVSTVQSISVQNSKLQDIFNELVATKGKFYSDATGWNGLVHLTVPMLTTSCVEGTGLNGTIPDETMPVYNIVLSVFLLLSPLKPWLK